MKRERTMNANTQQICTNDNRAYKSRSDDLCGNIGRKPYETPTTAPQNPADLPRASLYKPFQTHRLRLVW
jgi:hypothetical protein